MTGVLVVGGAGVFGGRLVEGLAATSTFDLAIAGRDLDRAEAEAREVMGRHPGRRVRSARLDARTPRADDLAAANVTIVANAAGPFQAGGYALADAAIRSGLHYVDLADARDFVAGFGELDASARAQGVVALTGASSTPALSMAALASVAEGWRSIDTVEVAISPGNRAPRGLSVMKAILSYAGQPVRVRLDGEWRDAPGWGLTVRRRLDGLRPRWLSLCDTPDLDLVPARYPSVRSAVFRAGLELPILHLGLAAASLAVRWRLVRSLVPFARAFRAIAEGFAGFGGDRGGMTVEARGTGADGRPACGRWSLVAEAGDGPFVPTLPALAAIRLLAAGKLEPGARACAGEIELATIEAEMTRHRIRTHIERAL